MKAIKKLFEKKVDERQEMDLLRVEHFSFWFMYWMLFAVMLIQTLFLEADFSLIKGEWIVFMSTSVVAVIGWVRKGVWSFYTRKVPGVKTWMIYSVVMSIVIGVPFGILSGFKTYGGYVPEVLCRVAAYIGGVFLLSMVLFFVIGGFAKRSERILAEKACEEENDEE